MVRMYSTNLRDRLDASGRPFTAVEAIARTFGACADYAAAARLVAGKEPWIVRPLRCFRARGRGRCRGRVLAFLQDSGDPSKGGVEWICPECESEGVIFGWEGTFFDFVARRAEEAEEEANEVETERTTVRLSLARFGEFLAQPALGARARCALLGGSLIGDTVELHLTERERAAIARVDGRSRP